ncbi:MAG: hypothetical protein K6G91_04060 [Kiritimatiellae bacterium]|nr:hypothetical protein [Kiritimatiellia bacterium]
MAKANEAEPLDQMAQTMRGGISDMMARTGGLEMRMVNRTKSQIAGDRHGKDR